MSEQLFCGAGKAEITPKETYLLDLQALGPQHFSGILDPLFVRMILLKSGSDSALIVSLDLDKVPEHEEFTELLRKKTGVPEENILFFGIHTHTAPIMGYRPFEPNGDVRKKPPEKQRAYYAYKEVLREGLQEAAQMAMDTLQPARLGCGHGESYINVNRICRYEARDEQGNPCVLVETGYNGAGPVDREVFVLKAETLAGEPIAFFVNYAVHNVVMFLHDCGDGGILVSHDMGGCVSLNLERRFPGVVAVWSSGAAGDLNPIMATQNYFPQVGDGRVDLSPVHDFKMSVEMRDRLAGRHLMDILSVCEKIKCDITHGAIQGDIQWIEKPDHSEDCHIRLRMVRIGDIALIGVNGELFSTLGGIIKKAAPVKNVAVINHDCSLMLDNPGYVLDDAANALCAAADAVKTPHNGFKAPAGYLPAQLEEKTKMLFCECSERKERYLWSFQKNC